MDKVLLARQLRDFARTSDRLLHQDQIALADVAALDRELRNLQAQDLTSLGSTMESSLRRLRLDGTVKEFAAAEPAAGFSLRRVLFGASDPARVAGRQQARVRQALETFADRLKHLVFALEI